MDSLAGDSDFAGHVRLGRTGCNEGKDAPVPGAVNLAPGCPECVYRLTSLHANKIRYFVPKVK